MISFRSILLATTILALGAVAGAAYAADAAVDNGVAARGRPMWDKYRDGDLKPAEVLTFAGAKPGMIAAEIKPEGGYWTRILSGIAGPSGEVYMVVPSNNASGEKGTVALDPSQNEPMAAIFRANSLTDAIEFKNTTAFSMGLGRSLSVPKQLDFVLSADDYHVFKGTEFAKVDFAVVNKGVFNAMKSGGVYLVIDNRANPGAGFTVAQTLNRVDPDAVKAEILGAGFQFDGESKALARPGDDHAKAATGDTTDQFVLRFVKPLNAPNSDKRPDAKVALAGYFGNTFKTNAGLIGPKPNGPRERRMMYNSDMTYEETGQRGTGDNPWLAGVLYYNADGVGCMRHVFPADARGFVACSPGRAAPGKKPGDIWFDGDTVFEMMGPGYYPFPNSNATPGGTLGSTPQEIAKSFGTHYKLAEEGKANAKVFLTTYQAFRATSEVDPKVLDKLFEEGLGRPMPNP